MIQGTVVFPAAGYLAMAGEAVRQVSGVEDSYSLRHVVLNQALVLQEGVDTEIFTNLHPVDLLQTDNVQWWNFTVASYNGQQWLKHCVGQVSAGPAAPQQVEKPTALPRKLETRKTFDILAKAGMQYGPKFQRLENITAGTLERKAVGTLTNDLNGDEDHYHLHPAIIDAALQAGLIAANYGKINPSNCAAMPTLLENVTVYRTAHKLDSEMSVSATTNVDAEKGEISGVFQVIADGKLVLDVPEASFTAIEGGQDRKSVVWERVF